MISTPRGGGKPLRFCQHQRRRRSRGRRGGRGRGARSVDGRWRTQKVSTRLVSSKLSAFSFNQNQIHVRDWTEPEPRRRRTSARYAQPLRLSRTAFKKQKTRFPEKKRLLIVNVLSLFVGFKVRMIWGPVRAQVHVTVCVCVCASRVCAARVQPQTDFNCSGGSCVGRI